MVLVAAAVSVLTSENVPVSLLRRVDFPTEGNPEGTGGRRGAERPCGCGSSPSHSTRHCVKLTDHSHSGVSNLVDVKAWRHRRQEKSERSEQLSLQPSSCAGNAGMAPSPLPPPLPVVGSSSSLLSFASLACASGALPWHKCCHPAEGEDLPFIHGGVKGRGGMRDLEHPQVPCRGLVLLSPGHLPRQSKVRARASS